MKECYILNTNNFGRKCDVRSVLSFKYQNIFRADMSSIVHRSENIIGAELLIDTNRLIESGVTKDELENVIFLGEADFASLKCSEVFLGKEKLFINIEKVSLCNVKLLKSISESNIKLKLIGVDLVVEITERDFCNNCVRIIEGLTYLKSEGVKLARDDFDYTAHINGRDERELELYYDYIKIETPINNIEVRTFNDFINMFGRKKRIIVERVETIEQLRNINLDKVWGLQGFLFCKGVSIPRLSHFY